MAKQSNNDLTHPARGPDSNLTLPYETHRLEPTIVLPRRTVLSSSENNIKIRISPVVEGVLVLSKDAWYWPWQVYERVNGLWEFKHLLDELRVWDCIFDSWKGDYYTFYNGGSIKRSRSPLNIRLRVLEARDNGASELLLSTQPWRSLVKKRRTSEQTPNLKIPSTKRPRSESHDTEEGYNRQDIPSLWLSAQKSSSPKTEQPIAAPVRQRNLEESHCRFLRLLELKPCNDSESIFCQLLQSFTERVEQDYSLSRTDPKFWTRTAGSPLGITGQGILSVVPLDIQQRVRGNDKFEEVDWADDSLLDILLANEIGNFPSATYTMTNIMRLLAGNHIEKGVLRPSTARDDADQVAFLSFQDRHWFFVFYDSVSRSVSCYDSMLAAGSSSSKDLSPVLHKWTQNKYTQDEPLTIHWPPAPQQATGSGDCGFFSLYTMMHILGRQPLPEDKVSEEERKQQGDWIRENVARRLTVILTENEDNDPQAASLYRLFFEKAGQKEHKSREEYTATHRGDKTDSSGRKEDNANGNTCSKDNEGNVKPTSIPISSKAGAFGDPDNNLTDIDINEMEDVQQSTDSCVNAHAVNTVEASLEESCSPPAGRELEEDSSIHIPGTAGIVSGSPIETTPTLPEQVPHSNHGVSKAGIPNNTTQSTGRKLDVDLDGESNPRVPLQDKPRVDSSTKSDATPQGTDRTNSAEEEIDDFSDQEDEVGEELDLPEDAPEIGKEHENKMGALLMEEVGLTMASTVAWVDKSTLDLTCRLLPWVSREDMEANIPISSADAWGIDIEWQPHQLLFLTIALHWSDSDSNGGLNSDTMGAGKTLQALGFFLLRYFHIQNYIHYKKHPEKHLPQDAEKDKRCPRTKPNSPIACCCEREIRESFFEKGPPLPGVFIICTPPSGIHSFMADSLKVRKGTLFQQRKCPRIAIQYQTRHPKGLEPLHQSELQSLCFLRANWNKETEAEETARPRANPVKSTGRAVKGKYTVKYSGYQPEPRQGEQLDMLKLLERTASTCIITTPQSYKTQILEPTAQTRTSTWSYQTYKDKPMVVVKSQLLYSCLWIDEMHLYIQGPAFQEPIVRYRRAYYDEFGRAPTTWGASGTPWVSNPVDLLRFYLKFLHSDDWRKIDKNNDLYELSKLDEKKVSLVQKSWKSFIDKTEEGNNSLNKDFHRVADAIKEYNRVLQIRRTQDTMWFNQEHAIKGGNGGTIHHVKVQLGKDEIAFLHTVESHQRREYVREKALWKDRKKRDKHYQEPAPVLPIGCDTWHTVKAAASIPLGVQEWKKLKQTETYSFVREDEHLASWLQDVHGESCTKWVEDADIKNSGKFRKLVELLEHIKTKSRIDGSICKVIVPVQSVPTLTAYRNLLVRMYPGQVAEYVAGCTSSTRINTLAEFEEVTAQNHNESKWILLATLSSVAVGLNLQRANYMIIVEPLGSSSWFQQMKARIWRSFQREHSHIYVLVSEAARCEMRAWKKLHTDSALDKEVNEGIIKPSYTITTLEASPEMEI